MTLFLFTLRKMRLELTRDCSHKILSLARLPIPTLPHRAFFNALCYIIKINTACQVIFKNEPLTASPGSIRRFFLFGES